ncbi:MAG: rane protein [Nocardioidaceae bacterium]|jgi:membrane protein|nr:rane protein [Nocardioidaceae bacterium]MDX6307944.1 rane protein [Nocardioidaceae bacterium]
MTDRQTVERRTDAGGDDVGRRADTPTEIPARGWWQIARRSVKEVSNDHLTLIAKGVAYSWFMALFPGLIAAISIYGLVTSPAQVTAQVSSLSSSLPASAQTLLTTQLKSLAGASGGALSIGLVVSIALALWSASAGMSGLVEALNIAYDEEEQRNFVVKRGLALLLTVGFVVFFGIAIGLIAVFPFLGGVAGSSLAVQVVLQVVRWAVLLSIAIIALGLLYRVGPDRDAPAVRWLSLGSIVATVIWVAASVGFAFYVNDVGSYAKTYGALTGVVVLLLWFWITALVVLIGAEINAEIEAQTIKDTTKGDPQPLGERGAVKADEPLASK